MHSPLYTYTHKCTCLYTHTHTHTHTHLYICIYIHIHTHITCEYTMHTTVHTSCTYTYIRSYERKHTHTYEQNNCIHEKFKVRVKSDNVKKIGMSCSLYTDFNKFFADIPTGSVYSKSDIERNDIVLDSDNV